MQAAPVAEVQVAEAAWNELKWASWQLISPVWLLALSVYQVGSMLLHYESPTTSMHTSN